MILIIKQSSVKRQGRWKGWWAEKVILISQKDGKKKQKTIFRIRSFYSNNSPSDSVVATADAFVEGAALALEFLGHEVKIKKMKKKNE